MRDQRPWDRQQRRSLRRRPAESGDGRKIGSGLSRFPGRKHTGSAGISRLAHPSASALTPVQSDRIALEHQGLCGYWTHQEVFAVYRTGHGIFPASDPGRVDFRPEFRTTRIPSAVARWRLARCSVLPHRPSNRQSRPAGRRHHRLYAYKLDADSEDGMCTMACRIWLAAFTCRSGFHQRLVDPAALTVTGYTNARFPAIPSASLDLISPLTLPGLS